MQPHIIELRLAPHLQKWSIYKILSILEIGSSRANYDDVLQVNKTSFMGIVYGAKPCSSFQWAH